MSRTENYPGRPRKLVLNLIGDAIIFQAVKRAKRKRKMAVRIAGIAER
jgi:hypothetical protein